MSRRVDCRPKGPPEDSANEHRDSQIEDHLGRPRLALLDRRLIAPGVKPKRVVSVCDW